MQLDPTRWLVSLAGFIYDWIITREWGKILLCLIPAFFVGSLAFAATLGSRLDRGRLAEWYMELGDKEIAEWEETWAPMNATSVNELAGAGKDGQQVDGSDPAGSQFPGSQPTGTDSAEDSGEESGKGKQVSRFAEALFRRVQLLIPSDRSQFVIAATLAGRGALEQARAMLERIAPADRRGYAPAHALLAQFLLLELQQQETKSDATATLLMHHVSQAKQWDRVPRPVLLAGSDLSLMKGDQTESLILLELSSRRFPEDHFALAQRAKLCKNERLFAEANANAQEYLNVRLSMDPKEQESRLRLAQSFAMAGDLEKAEATLRAAPDFESNSEIKRGVSQIYLMHYGNTRVATDGKLSVNLQYLDAAMRIDPTNPLIAEEVARLVRMQGPTPGIELITHLKARLAEGTATAVTHACLAEMRLMRNEKEEAITHLEQVVIRLPNAAEYLNNLAFCLAELHPDRREEALGYSNRAVAVSSAKPVADYFDTLSFVLSTLGRHKESVAAIETAIELNRRRPDFHTRAAEEYRHLNDESMAQVHEQVAERVRVEEAARIEAERIEAERQAAAKAEAERLEAIRQETEKLEAIRLAAEQALIAIEEEVAAEQAAQAAAEAEAAAEANGSTPTDPNSPDSDQPELSPSSPEDSTSASSTNASPDTP